MQKVTAAVIYNNGKVLLTRRAPGEKHAGWWEFPGGKIEEGETPQMCLARELLEELEIETVIGNLKGESIFEYETGAIHLEAYEATILSGELTLHVHDEYQWVSVEKLKEFKLLPADRPIAEQLECKAESDKISKNKQESGTK